MQSHHKTEQAWMVISSVTLVCASLQLMITQQSSIQIQMSLYMGQSQEIPNWNLHEYSSLFLFLMPIYLYFINKYSIKTIKYAAYFVILSSLIKCMTGNSYHYNYLNNLILNLLHPLVLLLPFSLLSNFSNQNKLFASLIPIFIPKVVVNFSDLFKHKYIVGAFQLSHGGADYYIQQLTVFTALLAIVSGTIANAMLKICESSEQKMCQIQLKQTKYSVLILILWGIIIGCEKIFSKCIYSYYQVQTRTSQLILIDIVIDLLALLTSYKMLRFFPAKLKNELILFINIIGVLGLILCQATIHSQLFQSKAVIILTLVLIRVGLLSFASPAISQFSPSIVTATILMFTARVMEQLFYFYIGNTNSQYYLLPNIAMIAIISLICSQIIRQWHNIVPRGYNKTENTYFQL